MSKELSSELALFNHKAFSDDNEVVKVMLGLSPDQAHAKEADDELTRHLLHEGRDNDSWRRLRKLAQLINSQSTAAKSQLTVVDLELTVLTAYQAELHGHKQADRIIKTVGTVASSNMKYVQTTHVAPPHPLDYQLPTLSPITNLLIELYPISAEQIKTALSEILDNPLTKIHYRTLCFIRHLYPETKRAKLNALLNDKFDITDPYAVVEQLHHFYQELIKHRFNFDYERFFKEFKLFQSHLNTAPKLDKAERYNYDHYAAFIETVKERAEELELSDDLETLTNNPEQKSVSWLLASTPKLRPLLAQFYPTPDSVDALNKQADELLVTPDGLAAHDSVLQKLLNQPFDTLRRSPELAVKIEGLKRSYQIRKILSRTERADIKASDMRPYLFNELNNKQVYPLNLAGLSFLSLPRDAAGPPARFPYTDINFKGAIFRHKSLINLILHGGNPSEIDWEKSGLLEQKNKYMHLHEMVCKARGLCSTIKQFITPDGIIKLYKQVLNAEKDLDSILNDALKLFTAKQSSNNFMWFWNHYFRGRNTKTECFYADCSTQLKSLLDDNPPKADAGPKLNA